MYTQHQRVGKCDHGLRPAAAHRLTGIYSTEGDLLTETLLLAGRDRTWDVKQQDFAPYVCVALFLETEASGL